MKKYTGRDNVYRLILIFLGLFVGLVITEFSLRIISPEPSQDFYVWPPDMQKIFKPFPGVMPGISGDSRFYINSEGIRGDEFSKDQEYRILAMGGSTTECLYLDQTEAWPHILQDELNKLDVCNVWVGNVGRSGMYTCDHIVQMKYLLPQYPRIDTIIMLLGANEILRVDASEEQRVAHAFSIHPVPSLTHIQSFPQNTAIWRLSRELISSYLRPAQTRPEVIQDEAGKWYISARENRKTAEIEYNLPDLESDLEKYNRSLNTIIDMSKSKYIRLILLTQPSMYRQDLSQTEKDLLWGGFIGLPNSAKYYSLEALIARNKKYNDKLIEVCQLRGIEYIDLSSRLPKDTTIFYDDFHFNENGANMVADVICEYLSQRAPFNRVGKDSWRTAY